MPLAPYTPGFYQPRHYGRYRSYPHTTVTPIPGAGYNADQLVWDEQFLNLEGAVPGMPVTRYGNYTQVPLLGLGDDVTPGQVMNVADVVSRIISNPDATLRAQGPAIVAATDKYLLNPLTDAMAKHMMPYFWKYAAPAFAVLYLGVGVSAYYSFLALKAVSAKRGVAANRRRLRPNALDRAKIQRALSEVHLAERSARNPNGVSRDRAVRNAIAAWGLNSDEAAILRSATHTTDVKKNRLRRSHRRSHR